MTIRKHWSTWPLIVNYKREGVGMPKRAYQSLTLQSELLMSAIWGPNMGHELSEILVEEANFYLLLGIINLLFNL